MKITIDLLNEKDLGDMVKAYVEKFYPKADKCYIRTIGVANENWFGVRKLKAVTSIEIEI